MVIAKIILPRRMPRYLSLLDYLVPDELADSIKVGQLTAVPFRNKEIFGVIAAVKQKENFTEQIANPASVYCDEQGHNLEIRTNADGSQTGYCIFDDGTECEEWAYYRKECKQGNKNV